MLIESFIKYVRYELNLSTCTVLSYSNDLKQFKAYLTRGKEAFVPQSVTTLDVRAWLMTLAEKDSVSTIKRKLQSLRSFYKYLQKRGVVTSNPANDVEMIKQVMAKNYAKPSKQPLTSLLNCISIIQLLSLYIKLISTNNY